MKLITAFCFLLCSVLFAKSQPSKKPEKKYPSLLWEITGNGLTKPSYLFGTMHISSKKVFHLSDSFFLGIKKCDVVALELNSETWQKDMVQMDKEQKTYRTFYADRDLSGGFISQNTFRINNDFVNNVRYALQRQPYIINSLLYRNSEGYDDFEENTFLDMYIYQTGKKLGKRSSGVESFYEMEMLSMGAEIDQANEKNKKRKNYDYDENPRMSADEAYRKGDLDMLDSLEKILLESEAFMEKFLYKRNEKQANAMDTIMKKGLSLFVGVGAAHLPGTRGVIELLRSKGYKLRPVKMVDRDDVQRDKIDHIKVPVTFIDNISEDGFFKVRLPGTLYKRSGGYDSDFGWQYADMANGAYYTVARIDNPAGFSGVSESEAYRKVDSMLYDNIPGKILSKKVTTKNGYKCIDITNKTRRGDIQRYNIIFTPFEVLIFKMSGTENYVNGKEAEEYFNSITLAPYTATTPVNYQPAGGGFAIQLPHKPFIEDENGGDWLWAANENSVNYLILKRTVFNDESLLRDTFNLGLMEESFAGGLTGLKQVSRKFSEKNKASVLDGLYETADSFYMNVHYVINGPHHYLVAAKGKNKTAITNDKVVASFKLTPYIYPAAKLFNDTLLNFSTKTPIAPYMNDSLKALMHQYESKKKYNYYRKDDEYQQYSQPQTMVFTNDTTGEIIIASKDIKPRYYFMNDSLKKYKLIADSLCANITDPLLISKKLDSLFKSTADYGGGAYDDVDSLYILKERKIGCSNNARQYYISYTDTGCSKIVTRYHLYKNGVDYSISTITGTADSESSFIKNFFDNFNTLKEITGNDIFKNKVDIFFTDYYSSDTSTRKIARSAITAVNFGKKDLPKMMDALDRLSLKDKDYFETKQAWIAALGSMEDSAAKPAILSHLKNIYDKAGDTAVFQVAVLHALTNQHTKEGYAAFKNYILQDPPVSENDYSYENDFWNDEDSLELLKPLFPEILQLANLDEYKEKVTDLMIKLADSGKLDAKDYETYVSKILFDARIALKKQLLKDEKKIQEDLAKEEDEKDTYSRYGSNNGNSQLIDYAVLLLPFYDKNPGVQKYIDKLWQVKDDETKFDLMLKMLEKQKPIPDTLINSFAAREEMKGRLFYRLSKMKKENLFPAKYKVQDEMALAFLYTGIDESDKVDDLPISIPGLRKYARRYFASLYKYGYNKNSSDRNEKLDSISFIKKQLIETDKGKGYVYFYKYRENKDDKWRIAISGLQPVDSISYKNIYTSLTGEKIKEDIPLDAQLAFELKKLIFEKREGSEKFFSGDGYNYNSNLLRRFID